MDAHRDEPATKKDLDQVKQELTQVKQVLTTRIDQVEQRLTAKIDRIAFQVIENREQMATKDELNGRFDEVMRSLDALMGVFTRVDEERVATTAWIRRVEGDVETNKSEIKKIKTAKELRDRKIESSGDRIIDRLNH